MKSMVNISFSRCSIPVRPFLLLLVFFFLCTFSHPFPVSASSSTTSLPLTNPSYPIFDSLEFDFSTFFGGNNSDSANGIAVDQVGNSYVVGTTSSDNFPTKNAYNSTYGGGNSDSFIAKFDSSGNLVFSTFFGGSGDDSGNAIAVDSLGNSYITGSTTSNNFPTRNAFNSTYGGGDSLGGDVFVAKFNSNGNLVFSTFLGGSNNDYGISIAVDSKGNCYVVGSTYSGNFPTKNVFNSTYGGFGDAFLAKFNSSGSLIFSTFLGGSDSDEASSIAVDGQGNSYIDGSSQSSDFPIKNVFNSSLNISSFKFLFIAKFDSTGNLVFSTFFGGSGFGSGFDPGIAIDSLGNIYVTGSTPSYDLPTKNAYNSTSSGFYDAFVAKFSAIGSLDFSTYLGGSANDRAFSIAVDDQGNSFVTGTTLSSDFPTKNAFQSVYGGGSYYDGDAFVTEFNSSGGLVFSSFLGGSYNDVGCCIALDGQGLSYVAGYTSSNHFPTRKAYQSTYGGRYDAFVVKFSPSMYTPPSHPQLPLIPPLLNLIFSSNFIYFAVLPGILIIGFVTLVEYRKYFSLKKQSNNKSHPSFSKYLVGKFTRNNKKSLLPNHISDKTFQILDEIEKENAPKN